MGGTLDSLIWLSFEGVTKNVDERWVWDVVYVDFKTFDKVPFDWFVQKVKADGIQSKLAILIYKLVGDRKQRIAVEGMKAYIQWFAPGIGVRIFVVCDIY